jgi:hypothetical protein
MQKEVAKEEQKIRDMTYILNKKLNTIHKSNYINSNIKYE